MPIPVTTTRRSVRSALGSPRRLEDQAHVLAAEAERVRQRGAHARRGARRRAGSRRARRGPARSRFAVGGSSPCWSARIVAAASTLPAAAIVWPTSDLVELTSTPPSPKTRAEGQRLDAVVLRRAGAVGVDVADVARRRARRRPGPAASRGSSPRPRDAAR